MPLRLPPLIFLFQPDGQAARRRLCEAERDTNQCVLSRRDTTPMASPDSSFGNAGIAEIIFYRDQNIVTPAGASRIRLALNGDIVLAGSANTTAGNRSDFAIAALLPNGSIDTNFSSSGYCFRCLQRLQRQSETTHGSSPAEQVLVLGISFEEPVPNW